MSREIVINWRTYAKELEAQLKEAEKVIDFYADTVNNYHAIQVSPNPNCSGIHYCDDEGKKAREYKTKYNSAVNKTGIKKKAWKRSVWIIAH